MENKNKKIGIWGYGLTGRSAVNYYHQQGYELAVVDTKELSATELEALAAKNITYFTEQNLNTFLNDHETIFPSPGIDLRSFMHHQSKYLNELDEFHSAWHKPIVSITGSIGKTTVTHLLAKLLTHAGNSIALGGNIGIPVFDLVAQQDSASMAVIEISSFQLEHTKKFAPDIAIWTNIHPNHLDRHGTEEEYFKAKAQMLAYQTNEQKALIPFSFKDKIVSKAQLHYFSLTTPSQDQLLTLPAHNVLYYIDSGSIIHCSNGTHCTLISCDALPPITFLENWLILIAALHILEVKFPDFSAIDLSLPEHRMEKVATVNGVDFINDSKATTAQSTLAAVNRLQHRPLLLLLGGKGKGVDREPLVQDLKGKTKKIYCFGGEAQALHAYCVKHEIESVACATLDDAFALIANDMKPGDHVLLSPAGTSYDLYKIFSERGDHFKRLVNELKLSHNS